jgi:predicted solute-binding protein
LNQLVPEQVGPYRPLRLGVVSYLNAVPLVHGLEADPRFEIVRDVPSKVADALHAGAVDLGVIPSIEYAAGDYAIVPRVAIASRGAVRSVALFHRRPLEEIRRVALDSSSRTSAALLRILLRDRLGHDPEYVVMPPSLPDMLEAADAALLIGDRALYFEGTESRLDLGAEWTERTGLPFVWAFWAGRPAAAGPGEVAGLQAALAAALESLPSIAATYNGAGVPGRAPGVGGPDRAALNEDYLRRNIRYRLEQAEALGLKEFYGRAFDLGLIARVPELRFYGGR